MGASLAKSPKKEAPSPTQSQPLRPLLFQYPNAARHAGQGHGTQGRANELERETMTQNLVTLNLTDAQLTAVVLP